MIENPIKRRPTRKIRVGSVYVGGDAPISVQSMTNTETCDVDATVAQIERCVDAGADITVKDEDGSTALLMAVKGNHAAIAKFLIENGANPNDIFIDEKCKAHNLLMDAIIVNNTEFATLLIEKGADLNLQNKDGKTALMYAVRKGDIISLKLLIEKGPDLNLQDKDGKTLLMHVMIQQFDFEKQKMI